MAVRKSELEITECDACGKRQINEPEDPALGYEGLAVHHQSSGGHGANWNACSARCIKQAILNALEKALDDGHSGSGSND